MPHKVQCYGVQQQGDVVVGFFRETDAAGNATHEFSVSVPVYDNRGQTIPTASIRPALEEAVHAYYRRRAPVAVELPPVAEQTFTLDIP